MPDRISKPGLYPEISSADYFADPCPAPSLTQSMAKILLDQSPLHAWHAHPRLNPDFRADEDTKFDVGNVAHKLMIGRGKDIVVLDFDDWRTKAAKEAREAAAAAGKVAVLGKTVSRAERMVKAAREQLNHRGIDWLFSEFGDGQGEVVAAWQEGDIWLRQMIDWLTNDRCTFADYKTTDMSVAPHNLGRMMVNAGWHIQAAMGERGLDVLHPKSAGRRRYLFIVQEAEVPYCLNVVEIGEAALTMGRKQIDMAVDLWRACFKRDRWPGYPAEIVTPEMPGWFESQTLTREIEHHERKSAMPHDLLMEG